MRAQYEVVIEPPAESGAEPAPVVIAPSPQ
jgi:hypothetical protein